MVSEDEFSSPGGSRIRVDGDRDRLTLSFEGEIDLAVEEQLKDALRVAMRGRPAVLVVDLSNVTFMDSTGLSFLIATHEECQARGCRLVVVPGGPHIHRLFEISGMLDLLEFAASTDRTVPRAQTSPPTGRAGALPRRRRGLE